MAAMTGFTHDRIRIPSEKLMDRNEAFRVLSREFPAGTPPEKIHGLVEKAFALQGGKVTDFAMTGKGITSDELTAVFLRDKLAKRLPRHAVERVLNAIRLTGKVPSKEKFRKDLVQSGLHFADKFFEANGAFIAFRRAYFMGERKDRREEMARNSWSTQEAATNITLNETGKRIKAYSDLTRIPPVFHPFVKYQVSWQHRLREGLERREVWAVHLATHFFEEGLKFDTGQPVRSLETTIREYKPIGETDAAFKAETLRYLDGGLWETFLQLTQRPGKRK
jgi:hypothetical protein